MRWGLWAAPGVSTYANDRANDQPTVAASAALEFCDGECSQVVRFFLLSGAAGSVATSPTSMALPPASPVVTATSAVVPAENTKKLESQVEMLTAQIGQLHGMMLQMLDNQEGAAMGALAFRMP